MEPERSLRLSIWEGTLAILFINWSTGVILTGYALALGASPKALALLGALPFLAQLTAPLALALRGSRKALVVRLNLLARLLFLPAVLAAFLPEGLRVPGLLLFAGLSQLLAAPVGVLWLSWMADLVPEERRGCYFGLRNALLGLVADRLPPLPATRWSSSWGWRRASSPCSSSASRPSPKNPGHPRCGKLWRAPGGTAPTAATWAWWPCGMGR